MCALDCTTFFIHNNYEMYTLYITVCTSSFTCYNETCNISFLQLIQKPKIKTISAIRIDYNEVDSEDIYNTHWYKFDNQNDALNCLLSIFCTLIMFCFTNELY